MFYMPGSYVVGRVVQGILAIEMFPWSGGVVDWDEQEVRGAGSLTILLALAISAVGGVCWAVRTWL